MTDFRMSKQDFAKIDPEINQIAMMRIIVEQTLEWNTGLYLVS